MIIRPLTLDDVQHSAEIHSESFDTHWDAVSLEGHIDKDLCLGIFTPKLSGFIIISIAADQAEIITLAVVPSQRRRGLAQKLVDAGSHYAAQGCAAVLFLEVAEDNMAAIALYKTSGFIPIGRRPAYYRREDGRVAALTYRKDL